MRADTFLLAAIALLAATGTAAAAGNTAPLADAGVDQTVTVNSTAYLDADGSVDPDGNITGVSWTIETPGGTTLAPDCRDCRRTEFDADSVGQYTVTLSVTDDDGATHSDTLYVTATNESGPEVSLSGPRSTAPGSTATFTADVSTDDAPLQTLTWLVNGSVVERASLNGSSAEVSLTHSFDSSAPVRAVVYDTLGERGSATQRVSVGSGSSVSSGCYAIWCGDGGADMRWTENGTTTVASTNGQEGIQTYQNGVLVTIENPTQSPKISEGINGEYRVEGSLSEVSDQYKNRQEDTNDEIFGGGPSIANNVGNDGGWVASDSVSDAVSDIANGLNISVPGSEEGSNSDGGIGDSDSGSGGGYRSGIMFQ